MRSQETEIEASYPRKWGGGSAAEEVNRLDQVFPRKASTLARLKCPW